MDEATAALIDQLPEGPMKRAMFERAQAPGNDVADMLCTFFGASPAAQADFIAFFESDGPRKVERLRQEAWRAHDGTPTADDLRRAACDAWNAAEKATTPTLMPKAEPPGCQAVPGVGFVTSGHLGLGVYTYDCDDPECDEAQPPEEQERRRAERRAEWDRAAHDGRPF